MSAAGTQQKLELYEGGDASSTLANPQRAALAAVGEGQGDAYDTRGGASSELNIAMTHYLGASVAPNTYTSGTVAGESGRLDPLTGLKEPAFAKLRIPLSQPLPRSGPASGGDTAAAVPATASSSSK